MGLKELANNTFSYIFNNFDEINGSVQPADYEDEENFYLVEPIVNREKIQNIPLNVDAYALIPAERLQHRLIKFKKTPLLYRCIIPYDKISILINHNELFKRYFNNIVVDVTAAFKNELNVSRSDTYIGNFLITPIKPYGTIFENIEDSEDLEIRFYSDVVSMQRGVQV